MHLSQYAADKNINKSNNLYGYAGNYNYGVQYANPIYQAYPNQQYYQGQSYGNAYDNNYQTGVNNQNLNSNNTHYNYQGTMNNNQNYYNISNNQGTIMTNQNNINPNINYNQGQIINSESNPIYTNDNEDRGIGHIPGVIAPHGNLNNNINQTPLNYGYQLPPQMPGEDYYNPYGKPQGY